MTYLQYLWARLWRDTSKKHDYVSYGGNREIIKLPGRRRYITVVYCINCRNALSILPWPEKLPWSIQYGCKKNK